MRNERYYTNNRITLFLKECKKLYLENKEYVDRMSLDNLFRVLLNKLGTSYNDSRFNAMFNGYFYKWIYDFKKIPNTKAFLNEGSTKFCVSNKEEEVVNEKTKIMLCLSVDSENLDEVIHRLFEFMGENDITHVSTVDRNISTQNIKIALVDMDAVRKINDFVSKDKFINGALKNSNPFMLNVNKIAHFVDIGLQPDEYNSILLNYMSYYFNCKIEFEGIDEVSREDFLSFLCNRYNALNTGIFSKHVAKNIFKTDNFNYEYLNKCKMLTELIIKSMQYESNLDLFESMYEKCKSSCFDNANNSLQLYEITGDLIDLDKNGYYNEEKLSKIKQYLFGNLIESENPDEDLLLPMIENNYKNRMLAYLEENSQTFDDYIDELVLIRYMNNGFVQLYDFHGGTLDNIDEVCELIYKSSVVNYSRSNNLFKIDIMRRILGDCNFYDSLRERNRAVLKTYIKGVISSAEKQRGYQKINKND